MVAPLIVDPELQARVTRQFNLKGELAPFRLTETVIPIFDIGRLVGLAPQEVVTPGLASSVRIGLQSITNHLVTGTPAIAATQVVAQTDTNPAAAAILADTGQLAAGIKHIRARFYSSDATAHDNRFQWRNAANAANIFEWPFTITGGASGMIYTFDMYISPALNERFRFTNIGAHVGVVTTEISFPASNIQTAT